MKTSVRFAFYTFLLFYPLALQAQDTSWVPETFTNIAQQNPSQAPAESFSILVTADKLVSRPGPVFTTGTEQNVQLPYLISHSENIRYPRWALRQGWEGEVILALEILEDGAVGRTAVMQSTGHRLLDESALRAVRTWKFHPAMENGKPVVTCIQIPIRFQLEQE